MSIRVMDDVWRHSRQRGTALLLLLAVADAANDSRWAWPRVGELARKTRLSPRQVRRLLCVVGVRATRADVETHGAGACLGEPPAELLIVAEPDPAGDWTSSSFWVPPYGEGAATLAAIDRRSFDGPWNE